MKFNSQLHSKNFFIKGILGKIESTFGNISKNRNDILVLNYHGIQKAFIDNFDQQLQFLLQHFSPISPEEFEKEIDNKNINQTNKPKFLLTFDDGILNNLNAINILEKYNIKAYFFIIPDFVNSKKPKEFFIRNIRPVINSHIDSNAEDFSPLSWEQIQEIIRKGHQIGSHTSSHTLTSESSDEELTYEIIESKKVLEEKLNCKIRSFCSINNTFASVNKNAARLIRLHYDFHFTTIAGKNIPFNQFAIKRVNVEAFWPDNTFRYAIGKWELKRWKEKAKKIDELMA